MPVFKPTDEKELAPKILPEGDFDFEIIKVDEGVGRDSGEPWLKLNLKVFDLAGKEHYVTDYLSFGPKSHRKLFGFCKSVKMEQAYRDGEITSDIVHGKCGRVHVKVEEANDYHPDGPKNVVGWYVAIKGPIAAPGVQVKPDIDPDDDIPF